jgi:hypothetical protein
MGGYGVPIVFGGVWAISTAVVGGIADWKRWRGGRGGGGSGGRVLIGGHNDDGGDGGGSDRNDDGVAIKNGDPGGGGADCGKTVAVYKHAAVKAVLIKQNYDAGELDCRFQDRHDGLDWAHIPRFMNPLTLKGRKYKIALDRILNV